MAQTRSRKSVRSRLKTLQNREEIAKKMDKMKQNRNLQLFLLLLLPVIFLVFGVLVFPPWGIKDETKIKTMVEKVRTGEAEAGQENTGRSEEKKSPELEGMRGGDEGGEKEAVEDNTGQRKQSNTVEEAEGKHKQKRDVENTRQTINKEVQLEGKSISNVQETESKVRLKPQQRATGQQNVSTQKETIVNKNHGSTVQGPLKIRSFELQGKMIKGEELKPSKQHDSSVRVYKFDNFLTERECNGLIQAHKKHVQEFSDVDPIFCCDDISTMNKNIRDAGEKMKLSQADFIPETTCVDTKYSNKLKTILKWSYSTAFYPGESPFTRIFEERVKQGTGLNPANGGKFQVTSYGKGVVKYNQENKSVGYKTHTDCIIGSSDLRDRMATILVYLDDVPDGGETSFTELGISVKPKKGMALVWNNMNEDGVCEPMSLHKAAEVKQGHKYIIQRWYYHEIFSSLGHRPPEPDIPERLPKTARVSCDEYEHGSCRWYDEWNYDHIPHYLEIMNSLS